MRRRGASGKWISAKKCREYNPDRFDFIWNKDYSKCKPIPLRWSDDPSYIRHQSEDFDGCSCRRRRA